MPDPVSVTAEMVTDLLQELATASASAPTDVNDSRWEYRQRTALLVAFDAEMVPLTDDDPAGESQRAFLVEDCERVAGPRGNRWRLLAPVREAAIRRAQTPQRLLELALAPSHEADRAYEMSVAYLRGNAPPIEQQTQPELFGTLQAIEWLKPLGRSLPPIDDVRAELELANLLQPLRDLVGESFVGRVAELDVLAAYIASTPGQSSADSTVPPDFQPLVIRGPGGIGKSTLLATLILSTCRTSHATRPFAYLNFDRGPI